MKTKNSARSGLLAGGNWIVDQVKLVDVFPQREQLANIRSQSQGTGGAPYNVLRNLACFTSHTTAVGVVGRDTYGAQLKDLLHSEGTNVSGLMEIAGRVTGHKMRIIGRQQQIVSVGEQSTDGVVRIG